MDLRKFLWAYKGRIQMLTRAWFAGWSFWHIFQRKHEVSETEKHHFENPPPVCVCVCVCVCMSVCVCVFVSLCVSVLLGRPFFRGLVAGETSKKPTSHYWDPPHFGASPEIACEYFVGAAFYTVQECTSDCGLSPPLNG